MNVGEHIKERRQNLDKVKRYAEQNFGYTFVPIHPKPFEHLILSRAEM